MVNPVPGGVTAARGFLAAGVACGLRKEGDARPDLALIVSEGPAVAAGVFTRNVVQAAPVRVSREHLAGAAARAIVANAGCANACTGPEGMGAAHRTVEAVAEALGAARREVLVASTGVIGLPLPVDRVVAGVREAAASLTREGGARAALAILTTDTRVKEVAVSLPLGGRTITIGGIAKGSGMIKPNMATMLSFLTTDAAIEPGVLEMALRSAVDRSFNMITVDNDTSTNDTVLILANGLAGNEPVRVGTAAHQAFQQALDHVCAELARAVARDGEGAKKLLEVVVQGAASPEDARRAALAVAGSSLVKTAVFGADANWGRVMAALGYSGASFDPERVQIYLGPLKLVEDGRGAGFDEVLARTVLEQETVRLEVNLQGGWAQATAWGCDLGYDYITINGSYRS